jgi:hypothetical protein
MANREIHTADDVPLVEIAEKTENLVNYFNEADRPFRDIFVEMVDQQTFLDETRANYKTWDKLSEGEFPAATRADDDPYRQMTIRTHEYGDGLGFTQKFIEQSTSDHVLKQVRNVLERGKETEEQVIHDVIFNGISDGSQDVWFDVPDHGNYSFSRDHDHVFADTAELFGDSNAHRASEHIEMAADDLRHHGWDGQKVGLMSIEMKRRLRNELSWDADYHIPMATGMRSNNLRETTFQIDGVDLLTTPYLSGDEFYIVSVGDNPVKEVMPRDMQITQPTGGPVREPGQILNATATMDFGVSMVNPLGAVHFEGTGTNYTA